MHCSSVDYSAEQYITVQSRAEQCSEEQCRERETIPKQQLETQLGISFCASGHWTLDTGHYHLVQVEMIRNSKCAVKQVIYAQHNNMCIVY